MTDPKLPERIAINADGSQWLAYACSPGTASVQDTEYVRANLFDALQEESDEMSSKLLRLTHGKASDINVHYQSGYSAALKTHDPGRLTKERDALAVRLKAAEARSSLLDTAIQERNDTIRELTALKETVRRIEWCGIDGVSEECCPVCTARPPKHKDQCSMGATLTLPAPQQTSEHVEESPGQCARHCPACWRRDHDSDPLVAPMPQQTSADPTESRLPVRDDAGITTPTGGGDAEVPPAPSGDVPCPGGRRVLMADPRQPHAAGDGEVIPEAWTSEYRAGVERGRVDECVATVALLRGAMDHWLNVKDYHRASGLAEAISIAMSSKK